MCIAAQAVTHKCTFCCYKYCSSATYLTSHPRMKISVDSSKYYLLHRETDNMEFWKTCKRCIDVQQQLLQCKAIKCMLACLLCNKMCHASKFCSSNGPGKEL